MKKIKIALILIPFEKRVFDTISIPLGLAWLNSYLKKEHNDNIYIENYDLLLEPELEIELFSKIFICVFYFGIGRHIACYTVRR